MTRPPEHVRGDFGARFLAYHLPATWVLHEYKGSEDYGIDFHVEIFADGNPTGLEFGAQVKTTGRPLSEVQRITLKRSSLVYALSKPYPCMVVVVSEQDKAARYSWLERALPTERLSEVLSSREPKISLDFQLSAPLGPCR